MEISLQKGLTLPQMPSARSADTPVVTVKADSSVPTIPSAATQATQSIPAARVSDIALPTPTVDTENKRLEQLQKAAQTMFKDVYAVSDTTFTIFKDATGQYITRFHSLRDGKVTYIPEPRMLQYAQQTMPSSRDSIIAIHA